MQLITAIVIKTRGGRTYTYPKQILISEVSNVRKIVEKLVCGNLLRTYRRNRPFREYDIFFRAEVGLGLGVGVG